MNEKAIQDAYEMFKLGGYSGSIDDYKQLISTNGNALKDSYEIFKGGGYNQDINSFKTLMGIGSIKKKSSNGASTLEGGSSVSQKTDGDYTYGDSKSAYRKKGNQWLINNESTKGNYVAIKDPTGSRAKELNRNARKMSSLDVKSQEASIQIEDAKDLTSIASKDSEIFTGYPGKEKNKYEFRDGNWYEPNPEVEKTIQRETEKRKSLVGTAYEKTIAINIKNAIKDIPKTRVIEDDARIKALNKQFGKNASLDADYETFGDYDNSPERKDNKYRIKNNSWERLVPGATAWSSIENEGSINALNRRYGKNIDVKKAIVVKPREIDPFLKVNSNFLAQSEESAQKMLEKNFKRMGFIFEQIGAGDYIKVTPNNGAASMTFSFNNVGNSTRGAFSSPTGMGISNSNSEELKKNATEAVKLQSYLRLNASTENEDNLSAVNRIKNNINIREQKYDLSPLEKNNEYYNTQDYKNTFKELTFQQKKQEIKRRKDENASLSTSYGKGVVGDIYTSLFGEMEEYYTTKKDLKKFNNKLYNSEEYKLFLSEKEKYDEQQKEKYSKLHDELIIAKQSGNKESIKTVKAKIEGGFSKDLIGDNLTHITGTQNDLKRSMNDFNKRKEKLELDAKNGSLTQEQYDDGVESLSSEAQKLDVAAKNVAASQKKMNALAGIYVTEKAKSGGFLGNFTNSLLVGIDELISSDGLNPKQQKQQDKIEIESQDITPQQRQYYKDKGYNDEQIKNVFINNARKNAIAANKRAIIETFGSDLTTEESKQNLGFVEQALVGVAASLPSMALSLIPVVGSVASLGGMANMSYNAIEEEMLNDPDFETTSQADRAVVAVPYALVMGALERIGLKNMTAGKAGVAGQFILSQAAKIIPKGASRETVERIINSEVKNIFAKGGIKIVRGTLAEFETGLYQAAALDYGLKALYNELDPLDLKLTSGDSLTGGELFDTPDTKAGVAMSILEGGVAEAIGGFAMSTVMVGAQGLINGKISLYNEEDLKFFDDFSSDQEFKKLIVSKLKTEMLNGNMTKSEAQAALNDIDLVAGVFNSIDENIPELSKLYAFDLINEKRRLEKEVIGKDPALSKPSIDRIAEINEKLENLPRGVQVSNISERGIKIEDALENQPKKNKTVLVDGKRINRQDAEAELEEIKTKLADIDTQEQAKVVAEAVVAESPEVTQKRVDRIAEIETTIANDDATFADTGNRPLLAEARTELQTELETLKAEKDAIQEQAAGQVPVLTEATVGEEVVQGEPTAESQVLTEEGKAEEEVQLTIKEELQLIEEEKAKAPVVEAPVIEAPVVEAPVIEAPVIEAPVVKVKAPKRIDAPTTFSWSKVEEYDDAVIRSMKEIQYRKLKPLLELGKRTTVAQKKQIEEIKEKISIAEKILDKRANKIKTEIKKTEKGEPSDQTPRVRGIDNKGNPTEFSIVIDEKKGTVKAQLKKRGDVTPKRTKIEKGLKISTDENKKRFVTTADKTKIYIDEKVTPTPKAKTVKDLREAAYERLGLKSNVKTKRNAKIDFDEKDESLTNKILNILKEKYPEVKFEFTEDDIEFIDDPMVLMQLSNKMKIEFERLLTKNRPDLVERKLINKVLDDISTFSDEFGTPQNKIKLQKITLHWILKSSVILPEDGPKVVEALRISEAKKLDAFSYSNPNEIIEQFAGESKKEKIDPDTLSSFTNKKDIGNGVVVYDVENSDKGQEEARLILDTHFGENSNPWCLLYKDANGSLTRAKQHWFNTYPGPKRIAFRNGRLLCFYGGGKWWNRLDQSSNGIPITQKIPNDELQRKQMVEVSDNDANKVLSYGNKIKGNKDNGIYEEYDNNDNILYKETYKDGKADGESIGYDANGQIEYKVTYKDGKIDGESITYYENGQVRYKRTYKDGELDGDRIDYYANGQVRSKETYKDGKIDGDRITYYANGQIESKQTYKDGNRDGESIDYYTNGQIESKQTYKDGKIDGDRITYHANGQIEYKETYKDGKIDGDRITYYENGQVRSKQTYKDGKSILFQKNKQKEIIGQANVKALTVLVNRVKQRKDTIPHEYAHIYIRMFIDSAIVQEGIKRFGSEEALVQAIGEQVVQQKGEAYNWWVKFTNFILNLLSDKQVLQVLTDSFINRTDLNTYGFNEYTKNEVDNLLSKYLSQTPNGDIDGFTEFIQSTQPKPTPKAEAKAPTPKTETSKEIKEAIDKERLFLESMIEDGFLGFNEDLKLLNSNPYRYADEKNKKFSKKDKNGKFLFPVLHDKYVEFYLTIRGRITAPKAPTSKTKTEPVVETKAEKISRGAEMLKNMSEDERGIFLDDWYENKIPKESLPGGANAISLYEAKKLVPNPTSKPKRVSIDNAFSLSMEHSFVINIDGVVYGLNKYENPDATSDATDNYGDPKQYVWAYTNINEGGEVIETYESDINELINEIRSLKKTEAVVETEAEPVKKSTVKAEDIMGPIDSIKEEINEINNDIANLKQEAREKVNKISEEIINTKNESKIEELNDEIAGIEDDLEKALVPLQEELEGKVNELNEEVNNLDTKDPKNKKTVLEYLEQAKQSLIKLNKLTYAKLDLGITIETAKLIVDGLILAVKAGKTLNAAIKEMAAKYKKDGATIDNINKYIQSTKAKQQTNIEVLEQERNKFVEMREAVRKAQVTVTRESKFLRENAENAIREMLKGKVKTISETQMKSIMFRLAKFNVFSQTQYDNFMDYVDKVIGIADYDAKVKEANEKRKNAKKNTIGTNPKLGDISSDLLQSLSVMLNINAKLISKDVFNSYYDIVKMLSEKSAVLTLLQRENLINDVNKIVNSIEINNQKASELKEIYDNYKNKVIEDGVEKYTKTLEKMFKEGVIDINELELMKTFKSKIQGAKVKEKMTEQEIADEKAELIDEILNTPITLDAIVGDEFRLERDLVKKIKDLINKKALNKLNNKDLKQLYKIIDNINNGFVSKSTQQMVEKLNSNNNSEILEEAIPKDGPTIYKKIKQWITQRWSEDKYGINIAPLFNIDEQLGNFKTKPVFNSIFKDSSEAVSVYQSEMTKIEAQLRDAENEIEKSLKIKFAKKGRNEVILTKMKMMLYMLQLEYNSNINNPLVKGQVKQAMGTLDKTIKFAENNRKKSIYGKADIEQMKFIKDEFGIEVDGESQIDIDKLFNSFSKAEKKALKTLNDINSQMTKKATYTASVINGKKINTLENYVFYNTISENQEVENQTTEQINNINNNMQPNTESKNLEERDGNVHPIILDPFVATNRSARSVLLNFHLTEPIRTARKTLLKTKQNIKDGSDAMEIFEAVNIAYNTAVSDLLESNYVDSDAYFDLLSRTGYRSMLGSIPRAGAEITSNAFFVITNNPFDMAEGYYQYKKHKKLLDDISTAKNILTNLKSKVTSRNYPTDNLSSSFVDLSSKKGKPIISGKTKTKVVNGVLLVWDNVGQRWVDGVALIADKLISKPDQAVMRPLWFGAFARTFKKSTGIEPDYDKIISNDEEYMDKYKNELKEATENADSQIVSAGSSMNPFMGILQNVTRKKDGWVKKVIKNFNKFMNRFTIQEFYTARKGINALVGNGSISKTQGAQILAAVSLRMVSYVILTRVFSNIFVGSAAYLLGFGDDDDDEKSVYEKIKVLVGLEDDKGKNSIWNNLIAEFGFGDDDDKKSWRQLLSQGTLSAATTILLGRNFGNVVRIIQNKLIEKANEEYGEKIGLRDGEYDPYKDAIQFNQLQKNKIDEATDLLPIISGPFAPTINVLNLTFKLGTKEAPKEDRAILTRSKEKFRLAFEGAGVLGIVPFYRDLRKIMMEYTYKELKKELKETKEKKVKKDAKTASENRIKINLLRKMKGIYGNSYKDEINHEIKMIKYPEYKKEYNKKEEEVRKNILDKYGYENMEDFERNDKEEYNKVFGDESPFRKERANQVKITKEIKDRVNAFEDGKQYVPKKKKRKRKSESWDGIIRTTLGSSYTGNREYTGNRYTD